MHDFVYIFLTTANQNKLTSFSHVLCPCHWSIKGGLPAKLDQLLDLPSVSKTNTSFGVRKREISIVSKVRTRLNPFRHQSKKTSCEIARQSHPSALATLSRPLLSTERSLGSCECTVFLFQEIFYFEVTGFTNSFNLSTLHLESSRFNCRDSN